MDRLSLFKALGDNTRYAIYLELARAARPLSTGEVAESLGLHTNTVRPHLERMREVGLLAIETVSKGSVGRPQHRYSLAADAPSLGLEPAAYPLLAGLLANVADQLGPPPSEVAAIGREQGQVAALGRQQAGGCVAAIVAELTDLGFDPAVHQDGNTTTVAFTHCPYRQLAEAFPHLVCELHRGMMEGMADVLGGARVARFGTLEDRDPCQVDLVGR